MKRTKKVWAAGMSLVLFLCAGCGKPGNEKKTEEEKEEAFLTGLILPSHVQEQGKWTGACAEKLLADTGVHLEFYPNGSETTLKQYISAGTLPDLIGFDTGEERLLENLGLLLDLDKYQEQLPSVFQTEAYQEALNYCRENFGGEEKELLLLPVNVGEQCKKEYPWMPMLQWQPYEQAGCPKIESLWDYLDVVEEMYRYKPMTALQERVYGFSLYGESDDSVLSEVSALSHLYGIENGRISPLIEMDGETKEIRRITDDESFYKKALRFYFEANQRGLLDPDSRTQTYEGFRQKYDEGRILFANYSWIVEKYNEGIEKNEIKTNAYVPVTSSDMRIYQEPDSVAGTGIYFGISRNAVDKEGALKLLNWLYDPENITYLYENEEDAQPFEELGLTREEAGAPHRELGSSELLEKNKETSENPEEGVLGEASVQEGVSAVYMLPPMPTWIEKLTKEIGERVVELSWNMIYASNQEEFERYWKIMRTSVKSLGMDEVEEYYQGAWREALEKEKLYLKVE